MMLSKMDYNFGCHMIGNDCFKWVVNDNCLNEKVSALTRALDFLEMSESCIIIIIIRISFLV